MKLRLNTLLAKTDHLSSIFQKMISEYHVFFNKLDTNFRGERKTYDAASGTIDLPSERGNKSVATTVREKLDWFEENSSEYINALFAQEATNASGVAKAVLVVDSKVWGEFTSLELLRLKSLIENGNIEQMYSAIPTRSDAEEWKPTTQDMYKDREIFEGTKLEGEKKSIAKEQYIIPDPNIEKVKSGSYTPTVGSKDTIIKLGDYTFQKFSGEWSARQKAELLRRRSTLLSAVIEALKIANEAEVVSSKLNAEKIFSYLHQGKND